MVLFAFFSERKGEFPVAKSREIMGNIQMKRISFESFDLPRKGQRFVLGPLPRGRPEANWMKQLPWHLSATIPPEQEAIFREVLGTEPDPLGRPLEPLVQSVIQQLADGQLFLRVFMLRPGFGIGPGKTPEEHKARLERWLPPGWRFSTDRMILEWLMGVRFGSPKRNTQVRNGQAPLLIGPCSPQKIFDALQKWRACARWLENGQLWVFSLPPRTKSYYLKSIARSSRSSPIPD